jgi:hypothetical protein
MHYFSHGIKCIGDFFSISWVSPAKAAVMLAENHQSVLSSAFFSAAILLVILYLGNGEKKIKCM